MEVKELIKEILSPDHKAIYVVSSEELYFTDKLLNAIQELYLDKEHQEFNQTVVYGKDLDCRTILDMAREFPFFGDRKLIIVKDAQEIKEWEPLLNYAKNPVQSTLLIISFSKKPDGRSAWLKQVKSLGFYFEFLSIKDYQLPAFIKNVSKDLKLDMDEDSILLLVDYVGNDLSKIQNELEKLKLNISKGHKVKKEDISKFIGISKEFNVFELNKAISSKDHRKIYWICLNMSQQTKSTQLFATVGALFNHFQKIWISKVYYKMNDDDLSKLLKLPFKTFIKEYREAASHYSLFNIEQAIHLLKEYDLKAKGMYHRNSNDQDLYMELALKINQL